MLELTIAEAIAAKRLGWVHEGQPVKFFRLTDMVRGQKTARATQLGVKTCRRCGLFMVDSAAAHCGGCRALRREAYHVKTAAKQRAEEKAAAGSETAFAANLLKANADAVVANLGYKAPQAQTSVAAAKAHLAAVDADAVVGASAQISPKKRKRALPTVAPTNAPTSLQHWSLLEMPGGLSKERLNVDTLEVKNTNATPDALGFASASCATTSSAPSVSTTSGVRVPKKKKKTRRK